MVLELKVVIIPEPVYYLGLLMSSLFNDLLYCISCR